MMESYEPLTNVKHILELKKNLISLGYLEKLGYTFHIQPGCGCLKIKKGALVVMIEGLEIEQQSLQDRGFSCDR